MRIIYAELNAVQEMQSFFIKKLNEKCEKVLDKDNIHISYHAL